jgi:hypothetical protein
MAPPHGGRLIRRRVLWPQCERRYLSTPLPFNAGAATEWSA